jgi:hypothetical protein
LYVGISRRVQVTFATAEPRSPCQRFRHEMALLTVRRSPD